MRSASFSAEELAAAGDSNKASQDSESCCNRKNVSLFVAGLAGRRPPGACRHLVKDRMERSGMHWKVPGAHAMLHLRTIHANGDWTEYQSFRIAQETARQYPNRQALKNKT